MDAICVFAAASEKLPRIYRELAYDLGGRIAQAGRALVYGAGDTGLMGAVARGVKAAGGAVIGVIPEKMNLPGVAFPACDELIVTRTMRERKAIMDERASAFIALPGGFGTFEELLEVITLKQVGYHDRPIVLLNANGYYDGLLELFENMVREGFAREGCRELYAVARDAREALFSIAAYRPMPRTDAWLVDIGDGETKE